MALVCTPGDEDEEDNEERFGTMARGPAWGTSASPTRQLAEIGTMTTRTAKTPDLRKACGPRDAARSCLDC